MAPDLHQPDSISISKMVVDCVIGAYPSERKLPQAVQLDFQIFFDIKEMASSDDLSCTVDYRRLAGELRFLLEATRFNLLESAAYTLARYALLPPLVSDNSVPVQKVVIDLMKLNVPQAIGRPSVRVEMRREEVEYEQEQSAFGRVDVIYTSRRCGIYRLCIDPGRSIPAHKHLVMKECEMVLGQGALLQGVEAPAGLAHFWPRGFVHRYDNPTDRPQAILCVDHPRFIPSDEVVTDEPLGDLAVVQKHDYYDSCELLGADR